MEFDKSKKRRGRIPKPLPENPYPGKDIRLIIIKEMVNVLCNSIINELENDDSDLYKIAHTYIDSEYFDLSPQAIHHIRKTFSREVLPLKTFVKKLADRVNDKKFTGGKFEVIDKV